jgi:predicted nucleic acid-binding protein
MPLLYALDTNILLRLSHRSHPLHRLVADCVLRLTDLDIELCYTSQNLGEFWNVSTRPVDRNGFGLSIQETARRFESVARNMTLLRENEAVFPTWLRLMKTHEVRGIQVHDAHLAAVLEVHNVSHLLTFNGSDFKRFPNVIAVHPQEVLVP